MKLDFIDNYRDELIAIRRDIHRYPEQGWCEFRTTGIIIKRLKELGFTVFYGKQIIDENSRIGVPPEETLQYYERKAIEYAAEPEMTAMITGSIGILECGEGLCTAFRFDIDCVVVNESNEESHIPY